MKTHTVIIFFEALPERVKTLEKLLKTFAEQTKTQTGCLEYRIHKNAEQDRQFIVYETWQSHDDYKAQFETEAMKEFAKELPPLLSQPFAAYFANEIHL
jgi:quinol monooxygenase YgiN